MEQVREVGFDGMGMDVQGATTLSVADLRQLTLSGCLQDVQRIEFCLLLLFTEGAGEHVVDFVTYPVGPNTLILVKPGQVQQFCLNPSLGGQLIVIDPLLLRPEPTDTYGSPSRTWWPACIELPDDLTRRFLATAADVSADSLSFAENPVRRLLLQHQLSTLLLRLRLHTEGDVPAAPPGKAYSLVARFRELAEEEYFLRESVPSYAVRLGCSQKTLTQACLTVEARTAKGILDERTLLEAKRLLAHGCDGVAQIAHRLGFSETTNFIRFFKKHEQVTPAQFRARQESPPLATQ